MTDINTLQRYKELLEKISPFPWDIDPDDRPDMEWNNHIVIKHQRRMTICFMTHDPKDNSQCEANNSL